MPQEKKQVAITWRDGMLFEGGVPGRLTVPTDGKGARGPSPVDLLLIAVAGCTGSDIVSILEKMRLKLTGLRIEVSGVRREEEPRRYLSMHLSYHLTGDALDETKVRRAIDLSLEKYCSVTHSLARDIAITYDVALA